jgi:hypothetical protein
MIRPDPKHVRVRANVAIDQTGTKQSQGSLVMRTGIFLSLFLAFCWLPISPVAAESIIVYQGQLQQQGAPYDGTAALRFRLYATAGDDFQIGPEITLDNVKVVDGLFQSELDFGAVFEDGERWLEIEVDGATLTPRQRLHASPMAHYAPGTWQSDGNIRFHHGTVGIGTASPGANLEVQGAVAAGFSSVAAGSASFVAGGMDNQALGQDSLAGAGWSNTAAEIGSVALGGVDNMSSGPGSFIGGGGENLAEGAGSAIAGGQANTAEGVLSIVGGGLDNVTSGYGSFVGAGIGNEAGGQASAIAGGASNVVSGNYGFVGGGTDNSVSAERAFVGGGRVNSAQAPYAFIAGGDSNDAAGQASFIGGSLESETTGEASFIGGGIFNSSTGFGSFVAGGRSNLAQGNHSFAGGSNARAMHHNTFVWADSNLDSFSSTGNDQFLVRAEGGVGINTNNPQAFTLAVNGDAAKPDGGSWSSLSDQNLKRNIQPMDPGSLDRLLSLEAYTFEFIEDAIENGLATPGRKAGFLAQQVAKVFPEWVNSDDQGNLFVTERGLTAILVEAMRELRETKGHRIQDLETENLALRARIEMLDDTVNRIEMLEARLELLESLEPSIVPARATVRQRLD